MAASEPTARGSVCSPALLAAILAGCQLQPLESPGVGAGTTAATTATASEPAACANYTSCSAVGPAAASTALEIGTGEECWATVVDGDTVGIYGGPQGGFHIWVAVRCAGLGSRVKLSMRILDRPSGVPISLVDPIERSVLLCDVGNGWDEAVRLFGYLDAFLPPEAEALVGREATLLVTVSSDDGDSTGGKRDIVLGDVTWFHQ